MNKSSTLLALTLLTQIACTSIPEVHEREIVGITDNATQVESRRCGDSIARARTRDSVYGLFTTIGTGIGLVGTVFTTLDVEFGKDTLVPVVSLVSTSLSFLSQIARSLDTGDVRDVHQDSWRPGVKLAMDAEQIVQQNAPQTQPLVDANTALSAQLGTWQIARERLAKEVDEAGEKAAQIKELDAQIAGAQAQIKENEARINEINKDAIALRQQAVSKFKQCDDAILF